MEYLNRLTMKMQLDKNFNFHAKCEKVGLTNLIFADDILLFCRGDSNFVAMLFATVTAFSLSTGLTMNPQKCKMFCGGADAVSKEAIKRITGFEEGELPVKYLGVPLTSKRLSINHYLPLIDKIVARVRHWTSKLLSYAGRVQLIQSISFAITHYWLQCFPLPKFVLAKTDSICRTFLWTGKSDKSRKSPIAWHIVCRPRCNGGLNIINLSIWNQVYDALIDDTPKVSWRFLLQCNSARPRALFTTWMLCHGRLPTKDRLIKFGFIQDSVCSLCNSAPETSANLFFQCRTVKDIWQAILEWIEIKHTPQDWSMELQWILNTIRKKGWKAKLLKLAFSEAIYGLWQLRNAVVFDTP
ncbi:uncharacterized protein LOC131623207 [Vicia villosa]|uniref:uncharacterized protein LOC131623207 n=1 Tax=Vicia villosa TaxID=3911 RepID=UPI00273B5C9D|nr:uncharacterized protein LOC131623207 [Vicia villosa]